MVEEKEACEIKTAITTLSLKRINNRITTGLRNVAALSLISTWR